MEPYLICFSPEVYHTWIKENPQYSNYVWVNSDVNLSTALQLPSTVYLMVLLPDLLDLWKGENPLTPTHFRQLEHEVMEGVRIHHLQYWLYKRPDLPPEAYTTGYKERYQKVLGT